MPLHNFRFRPADLATVFLCFMLIYQPGVDRKAVMKWITENIFGSLENVYDWGIFGFHKTVEWGSIIIFNLIYWLDLPIFERLKAYPNPWPWKSPDPKVRKEFSEQNRKAFWYIVKFHSTVLLITYGLTFLPKNRIEQFKWENTPEWSTSAFQIFVSMLIADCGHYWGHRMLHLPQFYKWHKMHHEFKQNTVLASFYITYQELLLTDLIPAGIGFAMFNMHIYTFWLYSIPLLLSAVWGHCGYSWYNMFNPLQPLPFSTEIELTHDMHHRGTRDGIFWNYGGGYYLWDRIAGTYLDPYADKEYLADKAAYIKRFLAAQEEDSITTEGDATKTH